MKLAKVITIMAALFNAACACVETAPPPASAAAAAPPPVSAPVAPPGQVTNEVGQSEARTEETTAPLPDVAAGATRCRLKNDVRVVSIRQEKDGHWVVVYENDGIAHAIPGRGGTREDAERLSARLTKNLVNSGFRCE